MGQIFRDFHFARGTTLRASVLRDRSGYGLLTKNFLLVIYFPLNISKMIPTAPLTPVGVTMSQCPIRILDCRPNSRIPLFYWSLTPTGVQGAVGVTKSQCSIRMLDCRLNSRILLICHLRLLV
jgi:hypothetical protein